jgi:uncharacterized membrane protein SpoIIM required for sporulation
MWIIKLILFLILSFIFVVWLVQFLSSVLFTPVDMSTYHEEFSESKKNKRKNRN